MARKPSSSPPRSQRTHAYRISKPASVPATLTALQESNAAYAAFILHREVAKNAKPRDYLICYEPFTTPASPTSSATCPNAKCRHPLCGTCATEMAKRDQNCCPFCRTPLDRLKRDRREPRGDLIETLLLDLGMHSEVPVEAENAGGSTAWVIRALEDEMDALDDGGEATVPWWAREGVLGQGLGVR